MRKESLGVCGKYHVLTYLLFIMGLFLAIDAMAHDLAVPTSSLITHCYLGNYHLIMPCSDSISQT